MTKKINATDDEATRIHTPAREEGAIEGDDATRVVPVEAGGDDATRMAPPRTARAATEMEADGDDATRMAPPHTARSSATEDDETRVTTAPAPGRRQKRVFAQGSLIRDRFRLEKEIGRGGMGVVFTARDMRKEEVGDQDSLIAIKLLSEDFKKHPDALRMLQQETRKTQKLAHPNVVTVYDFDRDGETVYMTMEYLIGMPLTDYIKEHPDGADELETVLPIISDIVHGLQYAHERGIIHSDLKPGNVFLLDDGVTKIVDLGIARAAMGGTSVGSRRSPGHKANASTEAQTQSPGETKTETLIALTPKYASPEMFDDAPPDPRDDIYALAVITYELLTGEHPFGGRPANEVKEVMHTPETVPGLNERQWKGLLSGLAMERDERCPSAEEFLETFLPKRKQPWKWATLGVGIAAIGFTAYLIMRPPQEAPLSEADQAIVTQQIEVARQHLEVGSLGNALENYKMILALPPYDKEPPGGGFIQHPFDSIALKDLDRLLETLQQQAEDAVEQERWQDAKAFVDAGLDVDNEHSGLLEIRQQIKESGH